MTRPIIEWLGRRQERKTWRRLKASPRGIAALRESTGVTCRGERPGFGRPAKRNTPTLTCWNTFHPNATRLPGLINLPSSTR